MLGPWDGALSNGGESVELYNNSQRRMDVVDYDDQSPWPVAADGAGVTLAKVNEYWTSQDEQNWHISRELGGTPGEPNFPQPDLTPMQTQLVSLYSTWRYDDTDRDLGATWQDPSLDDSAWPEGPALLFAGSEDAEPESGIRVVALADDGDADISSLKVYTHALDFGNADEGVEINDVAFTRVTKNNLTQTPGLTWARSTGVETQGTNNELPPLNGPLRELMQDYVTNTINNPNGTVTVTLEGLTPGTQYQTRIYSRRLDDDPRLAVFSFDVHGDGVPEHTLTLDQNDPTLDPPGLPDRDEPYAIEYSFQAETDQLTITVQQPGFNRPWIFYGLTNEVQDQVPPYRSHRVGSRAEHALLPSVLRLRRRSSGRSYDATAVGGRRWSRRVPQRHGDSPSEHAGWSAEPRDSGHAERGLCQAVGTDRRAGGFTECRGSERVGSRGASGGRRPPGSAVRRRTVCDGAPAPAADAGAGAIERDGGPFGRCDSGWN